MSLSVTDIEVRLPTKERRASCARVGRKPMAEVSVILDDGRSREIVVPVRVGRLLENEGIALPVDEEAAFDAIHALEGRVCFAMLTEMLSRRDHGSQEAADKLARYGFREQEIQSSLQRAASLRFLDDVRFVSSFIEERKRRGWGRRKVEAELRLRGIDVSIVPGYPEDFFDDEDDLARARRLLTRRSIPERNGYEKLVRHLMSKGFAYGVAADAVKEHIASQRDA